jgi:hypothetical protein
MLLMLLMLLMLPMLPMLPMLMYTRPQREALRSHRHNPAVPCPP